MKDQQLSGSQVRELLEFLQELCGAELVRPFAQAVLYFERHRLDKPTDSQKLVLLDRLGTVIRIIRDENGLLDKSARLLRILEVVRTADEILARRERKEIFTLIGNIEELAARLEQSQLASMLKRLVRLMVIFFRFSGRKWLLAPGRDLLAMKIELLILLGEKDASAVLNDLAVYDSLRAWKILLWRIEVASRWLILAVYQEAFEELLRLSELIKDALAEATASPWR